MTRRRGIRAALVAALAVILAGLSFFLVHSLRASASDAGAGHTVQRYRVHSQWAQSSFAPIAPQRGAAPGASCRADDAAAQAKRAAALRAAQARLAETSANWPAGARLLNGRGYNYDQAPSWAPHELLRPNAKER